MIYSLFHFICVKVSNGCPITEGWEESLKFFKKTLSFSIYDREVLGVLFGHGTVDFNVPTHTWEVFHRPAYKCSDLTIVPLFQFLERRSEFYILSFQHYIRIHFLKILLIIMR